ncbi:ABC transporter ATP-binding protein [Actinomyces sp. F1_1611]
MSEPLFALKDVTREFNRRGVTTRALSGVSLEVRSGRSLGVVGESGAGKSTILNLLLALDTPTEGEVTWRGEPLPPKGREATRQFRRQVQMVFQDPRSSLDPRMKIHRIVGEPLASLKIPGSHRARVDEVLAQVGLDPEVGDRYPAQFSGGQRQRIAIARALAPNPQVLVADEPVSALDVSVRADLLDLLAELKEQLGLTLLMVSHDIAVVARLCEEMVVLQSGRVEESGPTQTLLRTPTSDYTRRLLEAVPRLPA